MKAKEVLITCEYVKDEPTRIRLENGIKMEYKKGTTAEVPLHLVTRALKHGFEVVKVSQKPKPKKKTVKKED